MNNRVATQSLREDTEDGSVETLDQLLAARLEIYDPTPTRMDGPLVGTLVGLKDPQMPLVIYPGQPGTAALAARTTMDLTDEYIGGEIVLFFEGADPLRPLVMGCVRGEKNRRMPQPAGQVEVDADGQRLIVTAKEQIVLRCGKASITLTKAGKVLIKGDYVVSCSSGTNRIKGGSVQIN